MADTRFCSLADIWKTSGDKAPAAIEADGSFAARNALFEAARALRPAVSNKRVAIFCASTKLETVALLAAMKDAASIILPPNGQRDALLEIAGSFDILLCDATYAEDIPHLDIRTIDAKSSADENEDDTAIDLNKPVIFFTSGSTGAPKEIV